MLNPTSFRRFLPMKINFFLYRSKTNSYGTHPVYCRIRINGTLDEFSTGVFVSEQHWLPKQKRVSTHCDRYQILNDTLLRVEMEITALKTRLEATHTAVTANMIKREFKKTVDGPTTFLVVAQKYLIYLESQIGADVGITKTTFNYYKTMFNNLAIYLQKNKLQNAVCEEIRTKFIYNYQAYLKVNSAHKDKSGMKHNSMVKNIAMVKRILKYAKNQEIIEHNPLSDFSIRPATAPEPIYLDEAEVALLTHYQFDEAVLREVTDCYLFCCATGLGYQECFDFDYQKHIYIDQNKDAWIRIEREKTKRYKKVCYIPLMNRATTIIAKYPDGLPVPRNQKMNEVLRRIFRIVGISKDSNTHTARKSAANYWYDCGISEETIADCLGNTVDVLRKHYLTKNNKMKRIRSEFAQLRDLDKSDRGTANSDKI
jgi:site-specific recombinase XerD